MKRFLLKQESLLYSTRKKYFMIRTLTLIYYKLQPNFSHSNNNHDLESMSALLRTEIFKQLLHKVIAN